MTSYRWVIIILAFLATIINYLDRTALSYAITPLQQTYHLTNTDFGIIASAFGIGYLIMTVIGGVLVDKFGARKIWTFFAILWSIACASIGLATGFAWLFIFRMLLGVTEGPNFPALTRVAADWLPVKERARALALGLAAVPFASVIGAPIISQLVANIGWRLMFIVLGLLGLIWAICWVSLFRNTPKESRFVNQEELAIIHKEHGSLNQTKTSWRFMLSNRTLLINNYAFFAFGYLLFFAITWLPGYLEQTYHMQIKNVGWFLVAPWLLATLFILAGGAISDWLWQKTKSIRIARSHLIWICQLLSVFSFTPLLFTHSIMVTAFSISLGVAFGLMPNAAFYAINADLAFDRAATSLGIMDAAFAVAGILAPLLTGWLAHITGNFEGAILLMMTFTFSSAMLILLFQK
ncbi:MAG: MFS transporter [Gammaproteobacteria bacterium]|jgi:MFS family permease|nr:MFS transporter [Gammaproteobacteria bacterium]